MSASWYVEVVADVTGCKSSMELAAILNGLPDADGNELVSVRERGALTDMLSV